MQYTKLEMFAYATGYHDGRNGYEPDNFYINQGEDTRATLYAEGYANGAEDQTELEERI